MATKRDAANRSGDKNPDLITGKPGAHPIGAGIGAAAGGAAAGAAAGAVAGPVGAAAGAIIGGVAGGLAGKGVAEKIDPTAEDAYWRDEYPNRDYYTPDFPYEDLAPAYRYGWEARARYRDRTWDEVEPDLQNSWEASPSSRDLAWEKARRASRDAWDRIERAMPGDADTDGRRALPTKRLAAHSPVVADQGLFFGGNPPSRNLRVAKVDRFGRASLKG